VPLRSFTTDDPAGVSSALEFGDRILHRHRSADGIDDRFHDDPAEVAVVVPDDGRLAPLGVAVLYPADRHAGSPRPPWSIQFVLENGEEQHLCELVSAVLPSVGAEVWVRPEDDRLIEEIRRCWPDGYNCRRLHLMTVDLPVATEPLPSRPLDPDDAGDIAEVVRINNAAFSDHPDQSGMTDESVLAKLSRPGHSAEGVRLAEIDGRVNGFCWTQIHHMRGLGEISVIGLHPDVHGRGLGAAMTAAGLDWLHGQGLRRAILYVESANLTAIGSYRQLGFTVTTDDVSWVIPGSADD
jgi:ribosomal protein S18 acetylase RimI-like enzyme